MNCTGHLPCSVYSMVALSELALPLSSGVEMELKRIGVSVDQS